jgi:glutathione peroxidase-family protein
VDHEGVPYKRYSPKTSPFDLKGDIEELLRKKEAS